LGRHWVNCLRSLCSAQSSKRFPHLASLSFIVIDRSLEVATGHFILVD